MAKSLDLVIDRVKEKYPHVDHIALETWTELSQYEMEEWLVFDVRDLEEYQKSHIEDALLLPPNSTIEQFNTLVTQQFSDNKKNPRKLLFYCSVGYRSSQLIVRLMESNKLPQDLELYNLEGGIFLWANKGLPVAVKDAQGNNIRIESDSPVDVVHPYNWLWGRLLD